MAIATISFTVTDSDGSTASGSTTVQTDSITITSSVVVPQSAPTGTALTLTVKATALDPAATLTFGIPVSPGIAFTAIPGQPAGQAAWTFAF